jgi:hypothetical protein
VAILNSKEVLADECFVEDEMAHRLCFKNIHCPVSSLLRAIKYGKKGYFIPPREAVKLFRDWDGRSKEYRERVLKLFDKSKDGDITQEEIDDLEKLLWID